MDSKLKSRISYGSPTIKETVIIFIIGTGKEINPPWWWW
jgi:hypothetical protein